MYKSKKLYRQIIFYVSIFLAPIIVIIPAHALMPVSNEFQKMGSGDVLDENANYSDDINLHDMLSNDASIKELFANSTPEEQAQMQEVMEELKKITPEEWEKINMVAANMEKELEEEGRLDELAKMTDEELNEYIASYVADLDNKMAKENAATKATAAPPKVAPKPAKQSPALTVTGKDLLRENIQAIILSLDSFSLKTAAIPELSGEIESWARDGIVTEWGPVAKWNTIKKVTELLHNKFHKMMLTDPKTGKYRYLDYVYEDTALVNHIALLKVTLAENVPFIDVITFGFEKLGIDSQKATENCIRVIGQMVYNLKIFEAINKALDKYEPVAKEKRDAEEKLLKEAELEAKKKPVIARSAQSKDYSSYGADGMSTGDDYAAPYVDNYGSYPTYSTPRRGVTKSSRPYGSTSGGASQGASNAPTASSKDTDNKKKTEKEKEEDKKKKFTPTEQDIKTNKLLDTYEEEIEEIESRLEELSKQLQKAVAEQTASTRSKDTESINKVVPLSTKTNKSLKEVTASLKKAAAAVSDLHAQLPDPKFFIKPVNDSLRKIESFFAKINALYHVEELEKTIDETQMQAKKLEEKLKTAEQNLAQKQQEADVKAIDEAQKQRNQAQDNLHIKQAQTASLQQALADAVPVEVANALAGYKELQKKVKRFSKKRTVPTQEAQPQKPFNTVTAPAMPTAPEQTLMPRIPAQ